jgi:SAM-dependent methyltransferase
MASPTSMAVRLFKRRAVVVQRLRRLVPPAGFRSLQREFTRKRGLEIGGPSAVFMRFNRWPIYQLDCRLDNLDYAAATIWTGSQQSMATSSRFEHRFIGEATNPGDLEKGAYDFLLSSHVLEHTANPLTALETWKTLVKPGGLILVVVPHREATFDHRRPVTRVDHIVRDFETNVGEDDRTHFDEVLRLDDLSRHPEPLDHDALVLRTKQNLQHRSIHHHVFDTELVLRLMDLAGLRIEYVDPQLPNHICAVGRVVAVADNGVVLSESARWRLRSPFRSDRPDGG